jgi:DNA-binding CsgD family transcriptional regulator
MQLNPTTASTQWSHFTTPREEVGPIVAPAMIFDHLREGIALLDAAANVVFHNAALATILRGDHGLRLSAGRLRLEHPVDASRLRMAIDGCVRGESSARRPVVVRLSDPTRVYPILISVIRAGRDRGRTPPSDGVAVIVVVIDTEPKTNLDTSFLREAFHLSRAESALAIGLLEGAVLSDIAGSRGISLHTVRSQLKSIMLKTGVSRQSELINLLSRCDTVRRLAS